MKETKMANTSNASVALADTVLGREYYRITTQRHNSDREIRKDELILGQGPNWERNQNTGNESLVYPPGDIRSFKFHTEQEAIDAVFEVMKPNLEVALNLAYSGVKEGRSSTLNRGKRTVTRVDGARATMAIFEGEESDKQHTACNNEEEEDDDDYDDNYEDDNDYDEDEEEENEDGGCLTADSMFIIISAPLVSRQEKVNKEKVTVTVEGKEYSRIEERIIAGEWVDTGRKVIKRISILTYNDEPWFTPDTKLSNFEPEQKKDSKKDKSDKKRKRS